MSNAIRTAVTAAIIAAATSGAQAQTSTMPATPGKVTSHMIQSDEIRASKMIGSTVYDTQDRDIGKVSDLVVNKDGAVDAVVITVGSVLSMGGKSVALPLSDIKTEKNRLRLDHTKEQLQQMAAYELENPDTGAGSSSAPASGGHLGR